jgi:hypothetical protein
MFVFFVITSCVAVTVQHQQSDDAQDVAALTAFGKALNVSEWTVSTNWLSSKKSVCTWHGISCDNGRVTSIYLPFNRLRGQLPALFPAKLTSLNLDGWWTFGAPSPSQMTFLNGSTIPYTLWDLPELKVVDLAGSFVGGDLPRDIGNRAAARTLQHLRVPHCLISTEFHASFINMSSLVELKLERNPVRGSIPSFAAMPHLEKLACNFCALTGAIPDVWACCPKLKHLVFDGNGLTGALPASLALLTDLQEVAFNINNLTVATSGICTAFGQRKRDALGNGRHCHVGSDSNYTSYDANYPWIIRDVRNEYACPLPACLVGAGICNNSQSIVDRCR